MESYSLVAPRDPTQIQFILLLVAEDNLNLGIPWRVILVSKAQKSRRSRVFVAEEGIKIKSKTYHVFWKAIFPMPPFKGTCCNVFECYLDVDVKFISW